MTISHCPPTTMSTISGPPSVKDLKRKTSKKRKRKKSKKGRSNIETRGAIETTAAYKYVSITSQYPWLPNRWPRSSRSGTALCPRSEEDLVNDARELRTIVQDLKRRIAAIPIRNRPVPNTVDPHVLGVELKLRLAAKAPIVVEKVGRGGKMHFERGTSCLRVVPVYHINNQSDCIVDCTMRVDRRTGNIRRLKKPF